MTQQNTFLEIISATFKAGEVKSYVLAGGYFEIIDAPYPVSVRLVDRYGSVRGVMNNAEASFYMKQGDFDAIEITSANAQTIRFAYGSSEAGTRRTAGVVSVVDGGLALTMAGAAHAWTGGSPAVAGQFAQSQMWNPPDSGKNVFIKAFSLSTASGPTSVIAFVNKATIGGANPNQPVAVKNQDGTGPVLTARTGSNAAPTATPKNLALAVLAGAGFRQILLQEPVLLVPGAGLVFECTSVNIQINFDIEWVEQNT